MSLDVVDLRNFYAQQLGAVARRFVGRGIRSRWTDTRAQRVAGIGYATPYLGLFREEAERCLAFMPAAQGVVKWPSATPSLTTLVEELDLPLTDAAIDRVLLVHALETSEQVGAMLKEVWRVLAGGGRLLIVVPNRRGVWAPLDRTPFGSGRPYTASQLSQLLRDELFTPVTTGAALFVPPSRSRMMLRSARAWERAGAHWFPRFGGVVIVEATKQIYAKPATTRVVRSRRLVYTPAHSRSAVRTAVSGAAAMP